MHLLVQREPTCTLRQTHFIAEDPSDAQSIVAGPNAGTQKGVVSCTWCSISRRVYAWPRRQSCTSAAWEDFASHSYTTVQVLY